MADEPQTHDSTKPVVTTTEARQAVPQGVIYVLVVSLVLVIGAYAVIYLF